MNSEILDEIEKENKHPYFGLKSYWAFWRSIIFYSFPFLIVVLLSNSINIPSTEFVQNCIFGIMTVTVIIGFYFNLFGIVSYLKSKKSKETVTKKVLVGGIGNLLIFLTWIWVLFLSNIFNDGIGCMN